jgi:hypothetical protein
VEKRHNLELNYCSPHQIVYYSGDPIEKNELGVVRSTYVLYKRCIQDFGGKT